MKEPEINSSYMASKIAATINLVIGLFIIILIFIFFKESKIIEWHQYLLFIPIVSIGLGFINFSCNEFRKAAALDRSIKLLRK
jgi:hypothetical protein